MGLTRLTFGVANVSKPGSVRKVHFLIDSGASFSVVPRETLKELKIKPYRTDEYSLADGDLIHRDRGVAMFEYEGRQGVSDVVFGEEGDSNLLGAMTLESLGLVLDPFRRELRPLPLVLGGFRSS